MRPHHHGLVLFRTVRLVESANLLFFLGTLMTLGLFVMGNYQGFTDGSQRVLLQIAFVLALLCSATGLFYVVSLVVWMVQRRHALVLRLLYGLVASAAGAAAALSMGLLQAVVGAS
jgi:hypothetical protein